MLVTGCRVLVNMIMIITYSRTTRSWGSSLTGHTLDRQKKTQKQIIHNPVNDKVLT